MVLAIFLDEFNARLLLIECIRYVRTQRLDQILLARESHIIMCEL